MMSIKTFLKSHQATDYWLRCFMNCRDPRFVETVRAIGRDPNLLYFERRGEEHPDVSFYDVYIDCPSKGFFALLLQTLDALRYAQRFHLTPVVRWGDRCLYKESEQIFGADDPFEYFFEPVNGFTAADMEKAARVLLYCDGQRAFDRDHAFGVASKTIVERGIYEEYIAANAETYRAHIRLKGHVKDRICEGMARLGVNADSNILGVHVRATDFNNAYVGHARAVTLEEYIAATRRALEAHEFEGVFLATDDAGVVEYFSQGLGRSVLCYNDVFRSTDGAAVHFSKARRPYHNFEMGVEVLRDMYTLSRCSGLIGSYSNVCIAAQIVRKSEGGKYEYLHIIDKGFNTTGQTTYQAHYSRH